MGYFFSCSRSLDFFFCTQNSSLFFPRSARWVDSCRVNDNNKLTTRVYFIFRVRPAKDSICSLMNLWLSELTELVGVCWDQNTLKVYLIFGKTEMIQNNKFSTENKILSLFKSTLDETSLDSLVVVISREFQRNANDSPTLSNLLHRSQMANWKLKRAKIFHFTLIFSRDFHSFQFHELTAQNRDIRRESGRWIFAKRHQHDDVASTILIIENTTCVRWWWAKHSTTSPM